MLQPNFRNRILLAVLLGMLLPAVSLAQLVSGKVLSSGTRQPVSGVSVLIKGTTTGVATNNDGQFSLPAKKGDLIVVSGVEIKTTEVRINAETTYTIYVELNAKSMDEVVVTALGIRKEAKKLGYSVQEVKGADLVKAREPNALNGLVGKVAGLSVGASAEILGRPQILLRGNSVNFFVVDGVPISSDTWNISPDDIESYSVLKGPTAAALYGNRAVNGAIIINTKKGSRDKRGYSVEFNSSTMIEKGFNAFPKVQDEYGPGDHGRYSFTDGRGGGLNENLRNC